MFNLKSVGEHTYYIDLPSLIGIYKPDSSNSVYLIDSGNDGRVANRILKIIKQQGWEIKAIFNTHCHADHVGGNAYLQEQTNCKIYVPDIDCGAVSNPILNPVMLYGAYPPKELHHRFYLAEKSLARPLSEAELPEGLECIPLCGHTMGMVGFKTCDDVLFVADSVSSPEVLNKYTVTYLVDVEGYLKTLSELEDMQGKLFIPTHCGPVEDIKPLTQINRSYVERIVGEIVDFCGEPRLCDEIIKHFFDNNDIGFNMMQYALVSSTVRSYLSYLKERGDIMLEYKDNLLFWKKSA